MLSDVKITLKDAENTWNTQNSTNFNLKEKSEAFTNDINYTLQ